VTTTLAPPVSGFFPTISPNEMTNQECINSTGRCYTKTALWKTSFFTWPPKNERLLATLDDKVIAKLTNPGIFGIPYALDTSQELYSCDDKLIARIVWDFEWSQLFFPGYSNARVLDADGDDIAKIITTSLVGGTKKTFELQKNIQIQSPSGVEYARMQHRFGGIGVGPLRLAQYVTIQISLSSSELSAPITEPYFLLLVFSEQLATGLYWGPAFTLFFMFVILCCCCGGCCWCCRGCCKRDLRETKVNPNANPSETEPFLDEKKSKSMWACCTRYSANKSPGTGLPPTFASHAASEFRSMTGSGTETKK
jgi:hypothetical protein